MSKIDRRLIPVAFRGVEVGRSSDSGSDMRLVLKTTDDGPLQEYLVPVPAERDGEFTLIIRNYLSQIASADTFLGEIENAVGSHLSSLTIRPCESGGADEARMTITTDEMEVIPFDVEMPAGVLHAMIHSLPILVEESLLLPSLRRDEVDDDGLIRRRSPEAEFSALKYGLEQGRMPEDYEPERLTTSLDVIGVERVRALQQQAIEAERYEWAQWIKEYFDKKESDESEVPLL